MAQVKSYEKLSIRDNFLFQKVMRTKHLCKYLIEKNPAHPDPGHHLSGRRKSHRHDAGQQKHPS